MRNRLVQEDRGRSKFTLKRFDHCNWLIPALFALALVEFVI